MPECGGERPQLVRRSRWRSWRRRAVRSDAGHGAALTPAALRQLAAMRGSSRWCWAAPVNHWTSAGPPAPSPPTYDEPLPPVIAGARSRGVIGFPDSARCTIFANGNTAEQPTSTISSWCAVFTTGSCTIHRGMCEYAADTPSSSHPNGSTHTGNHAENHSPSRRAPAERVSPAGRRRSSARQRKARAAADNPRACVHDVATRDAGRSRPARGSHPACVDPAVERIGRVRRRGHATRETLWLDRRRPVAMSSDSRR